MTSSHVAHNCEIGDGGILGSGALLAGHVHIAPRAIISGNSRLRGIHYVGLRRAGIPEAIRRELRELFRLACVDSPPLELALRRTFTIGISSLARPSRNLPMIAAPNRIAYAVTLGLARLSQSRGGLACGTNAYS